jgi:hypothetical protein
MKLAELNGLLRKEAAALRALGTEPLAVASARDKFNDANTDDYWCAVQIGRAYWEQSQFFGSSMRGSYGTLRERGTMLLPPEDFASAVAKTCPIDAGREILKRLDVQGWHDLCAAAFEFPTSGIILALVVQFDQVWLHCSDPRSNYTDKLFALIADGLHFCCEIDDRFDDRIGKPELIRRAEMTPETLARLSASAKAQFSFEIVDENAAMLFASLVLPISAELRRITGGEIAIAAKIGADWRKLKYPWAKGSAHSPFSEFAFGELYYSENYYYALKSAAERKSWAAERMAKLTQLPLEELNTFGRSIDHDQIRRSFEQATGVDTFDDGDLMLLIDGGTTYVCHEGSLYRVDADGLSPIARNGAHQGETSSFDPWIENLEVIFRQKSLPAV